MANLTLSNINDFVGQELGVSSWITVDQSRINQFADCTGDHQWIHVDVDRAKRESPFRGAVAHGYLTLALIAPLARRSASFRRTPPQASITVWTKFDFWHRSRPGRGCGCVSSWSASSRRKLVSSLLKRGTRLKSMARISQR